MAAAIGILQAGRRIECSQMIENFRIRVFRTVVHHPNFSRAAEELLLTQPAVTQQIFDAVTFELPRSVTGRFDRCTESCAPLSK